ncbi:MAG: YceH family protein [bacterium]|nr:YceH family protein [bacterium]
MAKLLSPSEVRVLGALIEKQVSTPDYYPLTINALLSACNQKTNRQPVVTYSEETVLRALDRLREKKLARVIYDGRSPKYGHAFTSEMALDRAELAAMCVLMLRGPQTAGEIRGHAGRLHEYENLEAVERTLDALAAREGGALIIQLPLAAGSREARYAHLLAGVPRLEPVHAAGPAEAPPEELTLPESFLPHHAEEAAAAAPHDGPPRPAALPHELERLLRLEEEVRRLNEQVRELQQNYAEFRRQFE